MQYREVVVNATADGEAEQVLIERYGRVALGGPLHMHEVAQGDDRFTLDRISISNAVTAQIQTRDLTVGTASRGFAWHTTARRGALSRAPAVFRAGEPFSTTGAPHAEVVNVSFTLPSLQQMQHATLGVTGELAIDVTCTPTAAQSESWRAAVKVVAGLPLQEDRVRTNGYRLLALQLLYCFSDRERLEERNHLLVLRRQKFDQATEFMQHRAGDGIALIDVAAATGVSVRDLERLFAAFQPAGWTATRYLRELRLEGAYRELATARQDTTTVRATAQRWAFLHTGRFVTLFLAKYGVLPSEVLADC